MRDWSSIRYRDFYDVPRIFLTNRGAECFLFDCRFDDQRDDFDDCYDVFLMPHLGEADLTGDWTHLRDRALRFLGRIQVNHCMFDVTRRAFVDLSALDRALQPTLDHSRS